MIDEETLRQLDALSHGARPLIVCDVDEVILDFVRPFMAFLKHNGHTLVTRSYRLTGNVYDDRSGEAVDHAAVHRLLGAFFDAQHEWQTLIEGAREHLDMLEDTFDIVLLTAMPHAHRERRIRFLRDLGIRQTVLTVESDKGPSVARLGAHRPHVAFIDDLAPNHHSVAEHHPQARLYQIMAYTDYGGDMPEPPAHVRRHEDWAGLAAAIRQDLAWFQDLA